MYSTQDRIINSLLTVSLREKNGSASPSPPLSAVSSTWAAAGQADEVILATARRLELPPLVRQEITMVNQVQLAEGRRPHPPTVTRKSVSILLPEGGQGQGQV